MAFRFVAFLGDSITEGFGITAQPWPQLVQSRRAGQNFAANNLADSGDKVADMAAIFEESVVTAGGVSRGYTDVVFLIGTNDLPDGTAAATIWGTIQTKANVARNAGLGVVLCTIVPRKNGASWDAALQTRLETLNALILDAPNGDVPGAIVVDLYTDMGDSDPAELNATLDSGDGLHPNAAGHIQMADSFDAAVPW